MKYLWQSLRPSQWVKNLFIVLPLVFGKKMFVFPADLKVVAAFILFSAASSAAYLVNDLSDIETDKLHPTKRLRPIASGKVSVRTAKTIALVLSGISLFLSFCLNVDFGYLVLGYLLFNLLYSRTLKKIVIVDVFCIAAFFLMRIVAGGIVAGVVLSHWIIIMATLLALFLGFGKRRSELNLSGNAADHRHVLIQYDEYFIDQMITVVMSSIVVTYMLYTFDARTVREFGGEGLIFSIPFVYYGLFRYLYLIHKTKQDGDPTTVLFSDKMTQINMVLWALVCIAVIYFKF